EGVPAIQTVEYDWKDEELDIDFFERVDYRELKVELTDQSGAVYDVRVLESDSDKIGRASCREGGRGGGVGAGGGRPGRRWDARALVFFFKQKTAYEIET